MSKAIDSLYWGTAVSYDKVYTWITDRRYAVVMDGDGYAFHGPEGDFGRAKRGQCLLWDGAVITVE